MGNKIDITSTSLEKGLDMAKDFLDKLIMPSVEEVGLLIKDQVTLWRYKNQIVVLNKASEYCNKHNISPKTIPLKLLCPLLEYAGLEEDEELQDKWANLLANMVDSEQNIENHVFPYLLSQVSTDEFMLLENVYTMKKERISRLKNELEVFQKEKPSLEEKLNNKISEIDEKINLLKKQTSKNTNTWDLQREKWAIEKELNELNNKERSILASMNQPEFVPEKSLKDYEISNMTRLGVLKSIPRPYAYIGTHEIKNDPRKDYLLLEDLDIEIDSEEDDLILTELGELFIAACTE